MAAPKPIGMKQIFGDVGQSQQIHQLNDQVEELQAEITRLRVNTFNFGEKAALEQQIEQLTTRLANRGGVQEIAINLIDPDPVQPRQAFPHTVIKERAESLRRQGQKTPIVVIPQENGRYTLFDGELRWRAASLIEWLNLKAVFLLKEEILDRVEIFEGQIVTSIHSQKLHDLDLANALIRLFGYRDSSLKEQEDKIPKILNTALRRLQREQKHLELGEIRIADIETQQQWIETISFKEAEEKIIFATLLELQLNPISINNNIFPLLKLADDLKTAVRVEGLESSKARELNKLSSEQLNMNEAQALAIRTQATEIVRQKSLSLNQTRSLIQDLIRQYTPETTNLTQIQRTNKVLQNIKSVAISDLAPSRLKEVRQILKEKLGEIETLLCDQL